MRLLAALLLLPPALASRVRESLALSAGTVLGGRYSLLELLEPGRDAVDLFEPTEPGSDAKDRFHTTEKMGEGTFGVVWRARDLQGGGEVAVKLFKGRGRRYATAGDWQAEEADQECRLMQQMVAEGGSYPEGGAQICRCLESHAMDRKEGQPIFLVLELCGEGLLGLAKERYGEITAEDARRWMQQVLMALRFMAGLKRPVVHGDLSLRNIVVKDKREAKLIDFGKAQSVSRSQPWKDDVWDWARIYGYLLCGHSGLEHERHAGRYCRDGTRGLGSEEDWRLVDLGLKKKSPQEIMTASDEVPAAAAR